MFGKTFSFQLSRSENVVQNWKSWRRKVFRLFRDSLVVNSCHIIPDFYSHAPPNFFTQHLPFASRSFPLEKVIHCIEWEKFFRGEKEISSRLEDNVAFSDELFRKILLCQRLQKIFARKIIKLFPSRSEMMNFSLKYDFFRVTSRTL